MTYQTLVVNIVLVWLFMSLVYVIAYRRKRLDTVDIAWGLGFVVVAWSSYLQQPSSQSLAILGLVTVWGLRLANHIWQRSRKKQEDDPRYQAIASKWKGNYWVRAYFSIFMLQGVLVLVVSLPIFVATGEPLSGWAWLTWLGVLVWLKGFIFEAISDYQLANFLKLKDRPKVLQTGLWKYSRHPNYYGELVQWWGIGIIALQVSYGWIGLIGPLTLTLLIVFVSGIPPIEKRRAKDPEYREYMNRTSPLIPWKSLKSKV